MGDQTVGFAVGVILGERDKIIVLAVQELAQIFRTSGKPVVGGDGKQNRASVAQMGFAGEADGRIGNTVCQLAQGISRAGRNDEGI